MIERQCPTCQWKDGKRVKTCDLCRAAGIPEAPPEVRTPGLWLAVALSACGAVPAPARCLPRVPSIPVAARETYLCVTRRPEMPVIHVTGGAPEEFEMQLPNGETIGGSCVLVPLGAR